MNSLLLAALLVLGFICWPSNWDFWPQPGQYCPSTPKSKQVMYPNEATPGPVFQDCAPLQSVTNAWEFDNRVTCFISANRFVVNIVIADHNTVRVHSFVLVHLLFLSSTSIVFHAHTALAQPLCFVPPCPSSDPSSSFLQPRSYFHSIFEPLIHLRALHLPP